MPIQVVAQRRIAGPGRRVEAPLQHVAGQEPDTWNDPVALALRIGAYVDQHRTRGNGVACRPRIKSSQALPRRAEATLAGFSDWQLVLTLIAEAAIPFFVWGLYLCQRPRVGRLGLWLTVPGTLMVVSGIGFGVVVVRAAVLPVWTAWLLALGALFALRRSPEWAQRCSRAAELNAQ